MARTVRVAALQMGTTNIWDERPHTLERMLRLLQLAAEEKVQVALFPEIAFTTFFPRYYITDEARLAAFFEHGDVATAPDTRAVFDRARDLGIDICVGFAEAAPEGDRFNSCVYYHAASGQVLAKYRKIHLPGDVEPFPDPDAVNQLEKRYFKPGDLGFEAFRVPDLLREGDDATAAGHAGDQACDSQASGTPNGAVQGNVTGDPIFGMMICNDRRWSEPWRVLGLQGVEIVLCGYNTAGFAPHLWGASKDADPEEANRLSLFQHKLCMQAHGYTNATFSVSAARCGLDDGKYIMIAGSCITDPEGRIIAESKTMGDEVIVADCDLDMCRPGRTRTFDFGRHRRVEHYGRIVQQTGVVEPPLLTPGTGSVTKLKPATVAATAAAEATLLANDAPTEPVEAAVVPSTTPAPPTNPIQILLLNPTKDPTLTTALVSAAIPTLPADVSLTGLTVPTAPPAIFSRADALLAAAASLSAALDSTAAHDALVVASPLPGGNVAAADLLVAALREQCPGKPVVSALAAGVAAARALGGERVGLLVEDVGAKAALEDALLGACGGSSPFHCGGGIGVFGGAMPCGHAGAAAIAGVESCGLDELRVGAGGGGGGVEVEAEREHSLADDHDGPKRLSTPEADAVADKVLDRICAAARVLVADGPKKGPRADALVLGFCAPVPAAKVRAEVAARVLRCGDGGRKLPVVDPVVAGVQQVIGLVRMAGRMAGATAAGGEEAAAAAAAVGEATAGLVV
ncbi:carbon-nitrogen hydrolase [Lineolata rhizophorae]|uniref:Carbon-nitrogen hydrolase n=1 Tax=Lineolata rhizophorae TaxID=578093 RepID=A0A6A6NRT1_9PEZI|nr:carbon-nitrogen hydrolase [Lineolata rhizophorae]